MMIGDRGIGEQLGAKMPEKIAPGPKTRRRTENPPLAVLSPSVFIVSRDRTRSPHTEQGDDGRRPEHASGKQAVYRKTCIQLSGDKFCSNDCD